MQFGEGEVSCYSKIYHKPFDVGRDRAVWEENRVYSAIVQRLCRRPQFNSARLLAAQSYSDWPTTAYPVSFMWLS